MSIKKLILAAIVLGAVCGCSKSEVTSEDVKAYENATSGSTGAADAPKPDVNEER